MLQIDDCWSDEEFARAIGISFQSDDDAAPAEELLVLDDDDEKAMKRLGKKQI